MKTAHYGALGDGAATLAGYSSWQERAAYQYCLTLERFDAAGIVITQAEQSDIESAELAMSNCSEYLQSWLASAMSAAIAGDEIPSIQESYIPELIEFLALAITGQWGLIFVLFVKVGLKFLLERLKERIGDGAIDDVPETLSEIFLDKSDPENVVNRLDSLRSFLIINTSQSAEIDSVDWEHAEE